MIKSWLAVRHRLPFHKVVAVLVDFLNDTPHAFLNPRQGLVRSVVELAHGDHRVANHDYLQCLWNERRGKLNIALVTALQIGRAPKYMRTEYPARMIEPPKHMQAHTYVTAIQRARHESTLNKHLIA